MLRSAAVCMALALLLPLAGCGGTGEEAAPVDPCPRVDAPARKLTGSLLRQPLGTGLFEVLPVEGKARRSGAIGRLYLGDYTFRARGETDGGGLEGRRGATATPVPGQPAGFAETYAVAYRSDGRDFAGLVAIGRPTPGTRLATTGEAHFRGPVRLTLRDRRAGATDDETVLAGTVELLVRFGSRQAEVRFDGFATDTAGATPAPGVVPFEALTWDGIGMCGVRLGSNGQGGFRAVGAGGRIVNFAGPGAASSNGSAMLDAGFYGYDAATAQPEGVAGVLLIQGDSGVISGVFSAAEVN